MDISWNITEKHALTCMYLRDLCNSDDNQIGPLHNLVTWYKIKYTGEQLPQWDLQNNAPAFVLEVPPRNLLTSIFNFVLCDRVVQRAYWNNFRLSNFAFRFNLLSICLS